MTITTDDCKSLLASDLPLIASGALDAKGWKRLSKRNGPQGVERDFSHASGMFARVVESAGALRVSARSSSLAGLDAAAPLPAASPAPAVAPAPSPFWPAVSKRFIDVEKARVLTRKFVNEDYDDEAAEKMEQRMSRLDPVALAAQYTFAISIDPDNGDGSVAIITPTCYWKDEGCCYDQESPLRDLLPEGSDDLNGCGTWEIPEHGEPVELAFELLRRGFVWDPDFQRFIDEPALDTLAPLTEGRALEKGSRPSASPSAPKARL